MHVFKRIKWTYVLLSAAFLLLGILLVANPATSLVTICRVLGVAALIFGALRILTYFLREVDRVGGQSDFAMGAFCLILGALLALRAPAMGSFLSVVVGIFILVDCVFKLQIVLDTRRMGVSSWWVTLLFTVVSLIFGVLLVFDPFSGQQVLVVILGVALIAEGLQNLCAAIYAAVVVKDVKRAVQDFVDNATAVETSGEVVDDDQTDR